MTVSDTLPCSTLHKAMEGAMLSLQHQDNPGLRQRVEGILDGILAAQQEDGFLIIWTVSSDRASGMM